MVPEGRKVFADLTVRENLILGAYSRRDRQGIEQDLDHVNELFPRLLERKGQLAVPYPEVSNKCLPLAGP